MSAVTEITFGAAIAALKVGRRVRRAGWNGKGMWLALTPGSVIAGVQPSSAHNDDDGTVTSYSGASLNGAAKLYADVEKIDTLTIGAHIDMRAADGTLVIGWLASQTDMLATDWEIVDEAAKPAGTAL